MSYTATYLAYREPSTEPPKIATKKKIHLIDLLRLGVDGYWSPVGLQETFELLRWMSEKGAGYKGVYELLSKSPTCINFSNVSGFTGKRWSADLISRFQYALLSNHAGPDAVRWRKDHRIDVSETVIVPMRYYAPIPTSEASLERQITRLLTLRGQKLKAQHNECHPQADTVKQGTLLLNHSLYGRPAVYGFALSYAYGNEIHKGSCSRWHLQLLAEKDELFFDFIQRVDKWVDDLLVLPVKREEPLTFEAPTEAEVAAYMLEQTGWDKQAEEFCHHYQILGWPKGGMKWKEEVRRWMLFNPAVPSPVPDVPTCW